LGVRRSRYMLNTLKETPKEAVVVSHQLMLRACMIKQLASGIYTYLPLGLRSLQKIESIVREEMDRVGCQELLMPAVQPSELWEESGRWREYGRELLRIRDRKENDYCFGPTHEEVITDIVRREVRSYKDLPMNLYQIQSKFRDEIRPRFGLMRGREFIMKDAYSFDTSAESCDRSYWEMYEVYRRIFSRCGLVFRPVEADSGVIGGSYTHEFHVLAQSGEDEILSCDRCDYAANVERCELRDVTPGQAVELEPRLVETPNCKTIEEVSAFLGVSPQQCVKSLLYRVDDQLVAVFIPGDRELNETALRNRFAAIDLDLVTQAEEFARLGLHPGFIGPFELPDEVMTLVDPAVFGIERAVCGANRVDHHLVDVNPAGRISGERVVLRRAREGDACPRCDQGKLSSFRGIEVGQVFKLGTKYSESMGAEYLGQDGKNYPIVMGCYGIGVSRTMAAAIEQNHDEQGIVWPVPIAPFHVNILNLDIDDEGCNRAVEALEQGLELHGVEVLIDDRKERPGFKFKDADLIGLPIQVVVGKRNLKQGAVDLKIRRSGAKSSTPLAGAVDRVVAELKALRTEQ